MEVVKEKQNALKSTSENGINKYKVWKWANSHKGYVRIASSFIMTTTVTNERLKRKGYLSLESLKLKTI